MMYALAMFMGIAVGFGFRGLFGREKRKLGSWVMTEAWKGEKAALDVVTRFNTWRKKL